MRTFREQDFDLMASRVVDRFMGGAKLADAATQEAVNGALNPDQIARLTQAANTQAFLRLMEEQKGQGGHDMTREFDPVDTRQIVQQLIREAAPPCAAADAEGDDVLDALPLPDEHAAPVDMTMPSPDTLPEGLYPAASTAPAKRKPVPAPSAAAKDSLKEAAYRQRRLHKLAGLMQDQRHQNAQLFDDTFARLKVAMARAHGALSFAEFEKQALAAHSSDTAFGILNSMRISRHQVPLGFGEARAKAAALREYYIAEDTQELRLFDRLVKIAEEEQQLHAGVVQIEALCK